MKRNKKIKKEFYLLYLTTFLLGFQLSLTLYVLSNFMQVITGIENIGVFFLLAYVLSLYILVNLHHLIKRYGKSKIMFLFMSFKVLSLFFLGIYADSIFSIFFAIWSLSTDALIWANLDIIVEGFSKDSITGRIRGIHLTSMDTGILVGPFLAAWIVSTTGFGAVFLFASFITTLALFVLSRMLKVLLKSDKIKRDLSVRVVLNKMLRRKDLVRAYYASLMLELFYCVMTIYTPLYLLSIGLSWVEIGKIITVMLIPFVIIQIPLGIIADKKTGEKEWLVVGILIMSIATAMLSFVSTPSVYLWMVLLFLTRVGASIVQVMRDVFFYKKIGSQDVDFIDFFRTTRSVGYIVGTIFFSLFLIVMPLRMVFLMLGILMFTALVPLLRLHDTR